MRRRECAHSWRSGNHNSSGLRDRTPGFRYCLNGETTMHDIPNRVCIIGAGSSGIAACKVLQDHGIPFDCYEAGDRVGGNWVYENVNGMSSPYKSLFINTSKPRMQFSDYPMPDHYPVFPHHTQIAE